MKNAPMRFDGMSLRHNPATLTVSEENNIRVLNSPCCKADSLSYGTGLKRIAGEGEFCGNDCIAQFRALERLQLLNKRSKLILPHMQPIYAYLKELSLTAKPVNNVLSYRFVFIEAQSPRKKTADSVSVLTDTAGESLWDISYAYDISIERLVAMNPQIKYIDNLSEGERVKLC